MGKRKAKDNDTLNIYKWHFKSTVEVGR